MDHPPPKQTFVGHLQGSIYVTRCCFSDKHTPSSTRPIDPLLFFAMCLYLSLHSRTLLSLLLLECTDEPTNELDEPRLISLIEQYQNMLEPPLADDRVFEYLIRLGQSQFSFQRDDVHGLPRTLALFSTLWPARPHRKLPSNVVEAATGFDLDSLLLLGRSFYGKAKHGYVEPYERIDQLPPPARQLFVRKRQIAFLEHSRSYTNFARLQVEQLWALRP